jgi:hypothetical protein
MTWSAWFGVDRVAAIGRWCMWMCGVEAGKKRG